MQRIQRVVARDGHRFAVDKPVEPQRRAQCGDLLQHLLDFAVGQRHLVEPVFAAIVFKKNLLPVRRKFASLGFLITSASPQPRWRSA